MDFDLTDDQKRLRQVAREFAEGELGNTIAPYDERQTFPHEIVKKLGPLGFLGVLVADEYGGAGLDYVSYALIVKSSVAGTPRSASRCGRTTRCARTTSRRSAPRRRSGGTCRAWPRGRCSAPGG